MSQWPEKVQVFTDGASRGNPGPASIGVFVLTEDGSTLLEHGERLGDQTNNFAEYTAVLRALEICSEKEVASVQVFSDSELLVKQLNGIYKVKSEHLRGLYLQCQDLTQNFQKVQFTHVRREFNKTADALANKALDHLL